jgi:flagellar FliJ protein
MKFKFRLQKVLEHRRRLEDEAKRTYFEAQAKTREALDKLESLYVAIDDVRARASHLQSAGGGAQTIFSLQDTDLFIRGQKLRIEAQRKVVRELKQIEEQEQEVLIARAMDRKALEKLKEKRLQEFRTEIDLKEAAEADDMNVIRYKRAEGP